MDHHPLDAAIQPIPHPPNSPSIKSTSLQFREQDVAGNRVKGLPEVQIDDIFTAILFYKSIYMPQRNMSAGAERIYIKGIYASTHFILQAYLGDRGLSVSDWNAFFPALHVLNHSLILPRLSFREFRQFCHGVRRN